MVKNRRRCSSLALWLDANHPASRHLGVRRPSPAPSFYSSYMSNRPTPTTTPRLDRHQGHRRLYPVTGLETVDLDESRRILGGRAIRIPSTAAPVQISEDRCHVTSNPGAEWTWRDGGEFGRF